MQSDGLLLETFEVIILTDEQKVIIKKNGRFPVRACPGSGKTIAVAARFARKISTWEFSHRGVAALSFTNVAKAEIEKTLKDEFSANIPISYPHFIGTIDSFVDRFIFLPFGHLAMRCEQRPEMIGPPHNDWEPIGHGWYWRNSECNQYKCLLNDFSYGIDGNLISITSKSHFSNCRSGQNFCNMKKGQTCQKGYATQTDANYFAMRILNKFPQVTSALAHRFPCIMLDEAQDTSDIQMKIVDLLFSHGTEDMVLVGDQDQAIYEWRRANPQVFISKCRENEHNTCGLVENWRSSQAICNFFSKISSLATAPRAVNPEYADNTFLPQIWSINEGDYDHTISEFLALCQQNGINSPDEIAVLCRSNDLVNIIAGPSRQLTTLDPWNDRLTKNLIHGKFLFDRGNFSEAYRLYERTVFPIRFVTDATNKENMRETIQRYGLVRWRKEISAFINELPSTVGGNLIEWIRRANEIVPKHLAGLILKIKRDRRPKIYSQLSFEEIFRQNQILDMPGFKLGTIHSVKGESFQAVLLIVKHRAANGQTYQNVLSSSISENEELRTIYVAITRPRKVLIIAVPNGDLNIWKTRFGINY